MSPTSLLRKSADGKAGIAILGALVIPILLSATSCRSASSQTGAASAGQRLYESLCAQCHGVDGNGKGYTRFDPPVADLTTPAVQKQLDAQLLRTIHRGRAGTAMGQWELALSDEDISEVLRYVRRLGD